jgi:NAD(P)-dependent dehydrogenase (short-subunit alcohol dehydrogenase family)
VTDYSSVEALVAFAQSEFGGAPLQFVGANAGVIFPRTTTISGSPEEWALTYSVNVLGLFHTLRAFVPVLLEQDVQSAVEITASMAGVIFGGTGPYGTSKLAALGIAEALYSELNNAGALGKISLVSLCPGIVTTGLLETSSKVPGAQGILSAVEGDKTSAATVQGFNAVWDGGMSADYCASQVFAHLADGRFYCLLDKSSDTPDTIEAMITSRYEAMSSRRVTAPAVFSGGEASSLNGAGLDLAALSGGVAVITGSGSTAGLGFGLARAAAKLGMHVCISDVRQDAIDEAVAQLSAETPGVTVAGCACDVTDYSSVEALVAFAQSEFGGAPLQFVGANAGVIFPTTTILTGTEPVV